MVFYPGSHRIPLYRFNDGTHRAAPEEEADWFDYIDVQIRLRGLKERKFMARRGDVVIEHAGLVHGGSPIRDFGRTRESMVCHYFGMADCRERELDLVVMNGGHWVRRMPRRSGSIRPPSAGIGRSPRRPTSCAIPTSARASRRSFLPRASIITGISGTAKAGESR